ncbi:MAG: YCF48-related protein [Blastocatellia bacterium]
MLRLTAIAMLLLFGPLSGYISYLQPESGVNRISDLKYEPNSDRNSLQNRSEEVSKDAEFDIDLSIVDKNNLWAIGQKRRSDGTRIESIVLKSSDGGRSWNKQFADSGNYFYDICFVNSQTGWISGADGLILKSTDGGKSWAKQYTGTKSTLVEIKFIDPDWGWALAFNGEVLRTTDGGLRWGSHRIEIRRWVNYISFGDRHQGWVVGEDSQAYQTTDGGITWTDRGPALVSPLDRQNLHHADFRTVKFIGAKVGFMAAIITPKPENYEKEGQFRKGVVLKTQDGGRTWSVFMKKDWLEPISGEFVSEEEAWIIHGNNEEVIHTIDGGKSWVTVSSLPPGVRRIYFADKQNGWAEVGHGWFTDSVLYTNDGGQSWLKSKLPVG